MNLLLPQQVSMRSAMAKDVLTCMNCGNIIGSERLKYAKCFCSDLCLTEFWDEGKKKKDVKIMAKCGNCYRHFLPHRDYSFVVEDGRPYAIEVKTHEGRIHFCSINCAKTFQTTEADKMMGFMNAKQMNEFLNPKAETRYINGMVNTFTGVHKIVDEYKNRTCPQKERTECRVALTISDLFSLDNEEEFTRYLNDIIAEKTK